MVKSDDAKTPVQDARASGRPPSYLEARFYRTQGPPQSSARLLGVGAICRGRRRGFPAAQIIAQRLGQPLRPRILDRGLGVVGFHHQTSVLARPNDVKRQLPPIWASPWPRVSLEPRPSPP